MFSNFAILIKFLVFILQFIIIKEKFIKQL